MYGGADDFVDTCRRGDGTDTCDGGPPVATNGYPDPDCCYADVEIMVSCHTGGRSDLVDQHVLSRRRSAPTLSGSERS